MLYGLTIFLMEMHIEWYDTENKLAAVGLVYMMMQCLDRWSVNRWVNVETYLYIS